MTFYCRLQETSSRPLLYGTTSLSRYRERTQEERLGGSKANIENEVLIYSPSTYGNVPFILIV